MGTSHMSLAQFFKQNPIFGGFRTVSLFSHGAETIIDNVETEFVFYLYSDEVYLKCIAVSPFWIKMIAGFSKLVS